MAQPLRTSPTDIAAAAADIEHRISVSQNSQPNSSPSSSPHLSPRHKNEPCSRWGVREVDVQTFKSRHETRVSVMFTDETHQKMPLGQFIYLANKGVKRFEFSLLERKIEFLFNDDAKAQKFAGILRKFISPSASPADDFHSPSAHPIFNNWQIEEMSQGNSKDLPYVKATFISNEVDKRRVLFKQFSQLKDKD